MSVFTAIYRLMASLLLLAFVSCTEEVFDYNHPDVELFVEQLRSGRYVARTTDGLTPIPKFDKEDIGELLEYADDMREIPSFPLAPVSYSPGGKLRLGECILWTVETIRLGHPASMGCKLVYAYADDYEGMYFLSEKELHDAVTLYRDWWDSRKYPRTMWTIDPCFDEPLCGSGYMWW